MDDENSNEESTRMEEQQGQNTGQSMVSNGTQKAVKSGANNIKKKITEKATKEAGKAAVKKGIMMALSHIMAYVIIFIIALVVLIGVAMFFVTMPGMLMEKLKALGKAIGDAWASWFGKSDDSFVERKQIYEVMDYVEEMGYGLKEHGFLTHYLTEADVSSDKKKVYKGEHNGDNEIQHEDLGDDETCEYDKKQGVYRSSDTGLIVGACSDFIMQYIISDNYMYTIRNFNVSTDNWWDAVFNHIAALFGDDMNDRRGMILLLHDTGGVGSVNYNFWNEEDAYDASERGYIKIDPNSRKMKIKKGWISAVEIEYDLDGWTGRYGMPLEFLLSIHAATLMPDLAYDMTQSFDTNVRILLNETSSNKIIASYKTDDGVFIEKSMLDEQMDSGLFAGWSFTGEEAARIIKLGIIPPGPPAHMEGVCDCRFEDGELVEAKGQCLEYIKKVSSVMDDQTTENFSTYSPYIESVRDHWYRDVYFVVPVGSSLSFVKNDYNYENLMKERWTKYQVWGEDDETVPDNALLGRYKLYKVTVDEDGTYHESDSPETDPKVYETYDETRNQGDDVVTKYVKKAVNIDLPNEYEDLYWHMSADGKAYMAYETETGGTDSRDKMFDNDKIAEETDELKRKAKEHIYASLTTNVVKQDGDGIRTVTNDKIKQMFLTNKYFRYDGSAERAEQITQLRETWDIDYGALNKDELQKEITYLNKDGNATKVKAEDVSGTVQITQDSLNAFSMLENTHTLDADFIYRDFKELIVELGFFTKEELMDSIPRIMEFPVPELGTYGYPKRTLDKREQEKGTLIHSVKDYDAYYTMEMGVTQDVNKKGEGPETSFPPDPSDPAPMGSKPDSNAILDTLAPDLTAVSGVGDVQVTNPGQFKQDDWISTCLACWQYIVKENNRLGGGTSGITYADGGSTPMPFAETPSETRSTGDMIDCSGYSSWCLYTWFKDDKPEIAEHFSSQVNTEQMMSENYTEMFGLEEIPIAAHEDARPKLEPGDILVRYTDGGTHHVCIVKDPDGDGGVWTWDCGSQSHWDSMDNLDHTITRESFVGDNDAPGKIIRIDSKKKESGVYEGYKGNEAVVSPVTGILLEYGRYTDESVNKNTKETEEGTVEQITEELRENVDLKYPANSLIEGETTDESEDVSSKKTEDVEAKDPVVDKVGYAKILVLDGKHLASLISGSSTWDVSDLLEVNTTTGHEVYHDVLQQKDDMKTWDAKKTSVYGFKEFAENYYQYGVAGFTIYLDGFVCELPQQVDTPSDEKDPGKDNYKTCFHGEELTFDDFKSQGFGSLDNPSEKIQSRYIAEDDHQFASKSVTERVSAENQTKKSAGNVITTNDFVFIKEGTVLGRTMSDIEANSAEINGHPNRKNNDPSHDFKYYRPKYEEDDSHDDDDEEVLKWETDSYKYTGDRVIGNYLRVIMLDTNGEVVENVEDYMKLDEMTVKNQELGMEKFLFWMGCLAEGGEIAEQGGKWVSIANHDGVGASGDTHYFGLTDYDLPEYEKATGKREWASVMDMEELTNTYLIMIDEDIDWVKEKLGDNIPDGYLQGFISLAHNFGKVYPHPPPHDDFNWRADEYLATGQVSEETWAMDYSYSDRPEMDAAMEKRRRNEYSICSKGIYPEPYSDDHDTEYDWASYTNPDTPGVEYNLSEETPFTDWMNALGFQVTVDLPNLSDIGNGSGGGSN